MFSFLCYSFFTNKEIGGWPEFSSKMCKLPKNWPHSCPHRQRKDIFSVRATKNFFENFEMGTNFFACSSSSSSSSSTYFHVVEKRFPIEPKKYYFWHLSLVVSELKIFQKKLPCEFRNVMVLPMCKKWRKICEWKNAIIKIFLSFFTITMHKILVPFYRKILKVLKLGLNPIINPLTIRCENVKMQSENSPHYILLSCTI